jgi:hypothetical protein
MKVAPGDTNGGGVGLGFETVKKQHRIITEKRHNFDPSTSPAGTDNLHLMLNGEMRRAPGPPVAGAQTAWEDAYQVSFAEQWYSHRQAWARAA